MRGCGLELVEARLATTLRAISKKGWRAEEREEGMDEGGGRGVE